MFGCRFENQRLHMVLGFFWLAKEKTTRLYPHTNDDVVLLAPMEDRLAENLDVMTNSLYLWLFNMWWIVAIPISLMRVLVQRWLNTSIGRRKHHRNVAYIYMHTSCTLLGNSMPFRATTSADRWMVQTLATAAILLDTFMASYLFGIYAGRNSLCWRFDRIADIRAADLTVCILDLHGNYARDLQNQGLVVRLMDSPRFIESLYRGERCAFLMCRSYAPALTPNHKLHEMKQIMGIWYVSALIPHYSGLEERLNVLMQRIVENGLLVYLKERNVRLEYAKYRKDMLQLKPESLAEDSIAGASMYVWAYLIICGCCAVVCCVEIGLGRFASK